MIRKVKEENLLNHGRKKRHRIHEQWTIRVRVRGCCSERSHFLWPWGENKISFSMFIKGSTTCWIWLWALGQGACSMRPSYLWEEKVTRAKGMYVQRPEPLSQTEYNRNTLILGFSQYLHADNTMCHGLWEKQLSRSIQVKTDWYSHKKVLSLESSKRKHFTPRNGVLSSPLKNSSRCHRKLIFSLFSTPTKAFQLSTCDSFEWTQSILSSEYDIIYSISSSPLLSM